ncbi:MAG: UDP-glucose/GDP-mannose dehydrogenase family protein [Geodermatophilaceae bacterium]|nr:UDP-glucose/GDP-mannose dehydrogenase family protein [Geodermatophilaceae bacterium]
MDKDLTKSLRVSVIGTGYLGTTHAAGMAELGHQVIGMDTDEDKVARLSAGQVPFYEPGLPELLQRGLASGRLSFTTDYAEVAAKADIHFVCVGTPQQFGNDAADLRYVDASMRSLAAELTTPCLVVGKSTVPAGTARRLASRLRQEAPAGDDVELAWNPEFLREGYAVQDTLQPDRLVFGVSTASSEQRLRDVYAKVISDNDCPVVVTDLATAELVKVAANSFLATKISFINAMAEICEITGADVTTLAEALGHDSRIGPRFLKAGLGFGGGCLPKDIRAFMARAEELGVVQAVAFLREVDAINLRRRARMIDLAVEELGGQVDGKRIGVWGASFKPDSDDIRDSPALDVASALQSRGADVGVYDPQAMDNARKKYPELGYCRSAVDAAEGADLILHLTEWEEFRMLEPQRLDGIIRSKHILDGRSALDPESWRAAGWTFRALGRP